MVGFLIFLGVAPIVLMLWAIVIMVMIDIWRDFNS